MLNTFWGLQAMQTLGRQQELRDATVAWLDMRFLHDGDPELRSEAEWKTPAPIAFPPRPAPITAAPPPSMP